MGGKSGCVFSFCFSFFLVTVCASVKLRLLCTSSFWTDHVGQLLMSGFRCVVKCFTAFIHNTVGIKIWWTLKSLHECTEKSYELNTCLAAFLNRHLMLTPFQDTYIVLMRWCTGWKLHTWGEFCNYIDIRWEWKVSLFVLRTLSCYEGRWTFKKLQLWMWLCVHLPGRFRAKLVSLILVCLGFALTAQESVEACSDVASTILKLWFLAW